MSDGGNWQAPDPGGTPPPPPPPSLGGVPAGSGPPPAPPMGSMDPTAPMPTTPIPTAAPNAPAGRPRGKVIAGAVGALAIAGAGIFGITRISGDGAASGGASSPEGAANALLDALDNEDVLGAVDVLLPGERETFRQPMQDLMTELKRLEVVSDDNLSGVGGVDWEVTDRDVQVEETNVDDIVNLEVTATVGASVNGEELPLGDWIREQVDPEEIGTQTSDPTTESFPVTAVKKDGRWYLSIFYTAAERSRMSLGEDEVPEEGVALLGADSPEAAMDTLLGSITELDVEAVIGSLNPNEFEALQRYAPLVTAGMQEEVDHSLGESDVSFDVTDTAYDVSGSGDTRSVKVTAFTVEASAEGETMSLSLEDGCFIVEGAGESFNSCKELAEQPELDEIYAEVPELEDLVTTLQDTFADYEAPGFTVRQVDGKWYFSPMATVSDNALAVIRSLSREEIENLIEEFTNFAENMDDVSLVEDFDVPELEDFELPSAGGDDSPVVEDPTEDTIDDFDTDDTIDDFETEDTIDDFDTDDTLPYEVCYEETTGTAAADCFNGLVADGTISADDVPWYLAHPECGAAELVWSGEYYTSDDAEFAANLAEISACLAPFIASGEVSEYSVPPEVAHPECVAGLNPYSDTADDAALDEFIECAYS